MNGLQFVTLLYRFFVFFFFCGLRACPRMCARVCVCEGWWMLEDISRCTTHFSGLYPKYQLWANTLSSVGHTLSSSSEVFGASQRELNNGLFSLDLQLATHNVCVVVWSICGYMHRVCVYHGIANMHKHLFIYLFFFFFEVLSFHYCIFSFHREYIWN